MILKNQTKLEFAFKGDRNYVQGTDLYTKITELLAGEKGLALVRLKFVGLLRSNATLIWHVDKNMPFCESMHCAIGEVRDHAGPTRTFTVIPNPESSINNRHEYREEQIVTKADITDKTVLIHDLTGYSLIEEAVASIKYLSNAVAPPKSGKWLFAGIQLKEPMPAIRNREQILNVAQRQMIANRFSRNDVYLGDRMYGTIEFSVGDV